MCFVSLRSVQNLLGAILMASPVRIPAQIVEIPAGVPRMQSEAG